MVFMILLFLSLCIHNGSDTPLFLSFFGVGSVGGDGMDSKEYKVNEAGGDGGVIEAMVTAAGSGSATSGKLFKGEKYRHFDKSKLLFTDAQVRKDPSLIKKDVKTVMNEMESHVDELYCNHWAVVTTIFEPSEAVIKQAHVKNWCMVVVGDKKGPGETYNIDGSSGFTNHADDNHADGKQNPKDRPNFIFLTPKDQEELSHHLPIVSLLPWNHFGRKNVGYLYAILHGAQVVWDFDDDNGLIAAAGPDGGVPMEFEGFRTVKRDDSTNAKERRALREEESTEEAAEEHALLRKQAFLAAKASTASSSARRRLHKVVDSYELPDVCKVRIPAPQPPVNNPGSGINCSAFNPYPLMGAPATPSWPRGFPLSLIREPAVAKTEVSSVPKDRVAVVQSLANHDPDMDAIYRLTQPLPFDFPSAATAAAKSGSSEGSSSSSGNDDYLPVLVPDHLYAPYNAQATLHLYSSLWSLLLPISVHGRVSDIWRGYFMQRVCKAIGLRLAFAPSVVQQDRNAHNYMADFQSELPLYVFCYAVVLPLFLVCEEGLCLSLSCPSIAAACLHSLAT
jgi:hypothetical protein